MSMVSLPASISLVMHHVNYIKKTMKAQRKSSSTIVYYRLFFFDHSQLFPQCHDIQSDVYIHVSITIDLILGKYWQAAGKLNSYVITVT